MVKYFLLPIVDNCLNHIVCLQHTQHFTKEVNASFLQRSQVQSRVSYFEPGLCHEFEKTQDKSHTCIHTQYAYSLNYIHNMHIWLLCMVFCMSIVLM